MLGGRRNSDATIPRGGLSVGNGLVVAVVGNPKPASRTCKLAELMAGRIKELAGIGESPIVIDLAEHAEPLVRWGDPAVADLKAKVLAARALVVASPTYKGSYTGLLKCFLDHFDAGELKNVPTAAVMTGGSLVHALAVDVHLVPVLSEIGASCPARGLYVSGPDIDAPTEAVDRWLERSKGVLARALAA
jgi:FMN reductase